MIAGADGAAGAARVARTAEALRLAATRSGAADWRRWGTFLAERAWGTVREDYSADGSAWASFPFEHAHQRAYRWNEDGLAGWCDREQIICLSLALWNGRDPILKERPYGLTNQQGNHGEDAKDYWFYTDNLPSHAYASMVYKYPQARFPYDDLRVTNSRRGQDVGEYELFDALRTEWLADRYFDVVAEYAKPTPEDVVARFTVTNRGPDPAEIHVLPQLWYRNTWSWPPETAKPQIRAVRPGVARTEHEKLGERWFAVTSSLEGEPGESFAASDPPRLLFCDNESNQTALGHGRNAGQFTKDGINSHVVGGDTDATNAVSGSKVAAHVRATLAAGASIVVTARLSQVDLLEPLDIAAAVLAERRAEADEFYNALARPDLDADRRLVQRQALAGLLWSKQYYHYEVRQWLQGDPGQPVPPHQRWSGRNSDWQHLVAGDVILMPDPWEYPWFAAWDLAFHAVTVAMIDPDFAKEQVLLLLGPLYQHPHGQIPAYEWKFDDTNPPLHAWAAWRVYQLDRLARGHGDLDFLQRAYQALSLNVVWWLNQKDAADRGVFGGGFLGMDNVGVFDRDRPLPTGGTLAQADGTAWMARLLLQMIEITVELAREDSAFEDMLGRWVWDAWLVANALEKGVGRVSLWDESTAFYHDLVELPDGTVKPLEVFSMDSLIPILACTAIPLSDARQAAVIADRAAALREAYHHGDQDVRVLHQGADGSHLLLSVVDPGRLARMLERVLDPDQFLSEFGIRSLSAAHRASEFSFDAGGQTYTIGYEPAESTGRLFGGNSNWRGPIWMPVNYLLVEALNAHARFLGSGFTVEHPVGSGKCLGLAAVADNLAERLCRIFLRGPDGRRPVFGGNDYYDSDPHWRDLLPFHEYFHGDTAAGLGASHQTGWTATVALLLQYGGQLDFRSSGQ